MKQGAGISILESLRSLNKPWVGLVAILALTFYLRLLYFGQSIDGDVGNAAYQAWRMAAGEIVIDLEGPGKPPLYPMLYSLFIRILGPSVLGLKLFGTVLALMAVVAVYWVANQAYGKRVGLLAALLFGLFSSGPIVEGGTVNLETILHFPYVLAIGFFLRASVSGRPLWYFVAGLSAALAALVKQVGGVIFFVFLCYGVSEWWRIKALFLRRQLLYKYILLCAAALLPVIALIIFYRFHEYTLIQLYDSMFESNLRYMQRGHEYTKLLQLFSLNMKDVLSENGLLWIGTIFAAVHLGWEIKRGKGQPGDRILLWWIFWSFAALWATGTFYWHYFLQVIAPFSILAAYGIVASWKMVNSLSPLPRFVTRMGWATVLAATVIIFIRTDYKYFFSYTPAEQTIKQHELSEGVFDGYGVYNLALQEIAYYIHEHTHSNETIYVWGVAPQVYFLAQRKAATRYRNNFNMSALVTGKPLKALEGYASIVIEDLKKSPPAYVVQIFRLEDFPELQNFVQGKYIVDKNVELPVPPYKIHLYRRRPDSEALHLQRGVSLR